jgi:tetratricopeptide (TPR) repeat protein
MVEKRKGKGKDTQDFSKPQVFLPLLILLPVFFYFPSLNYPFHFDDYPNIIENPYIKDIKNLSFFIEGLKKQGTTFRAIPTATFALNYYFNKLSPFGYRLINLLIHIASGILVYFISRKLLLLRRDSNEDFVSLGSLLISLIFLLHPIQINTVVYIVQRNEGLSSFFILLSLYLFIRFRENDGKKIFYLLGTFFAIVGSIFSKEIGFMAIGVIILYDLIISWDTKEETLKRLKYYAIFIVPIVVYVLFFFKGGLLFLLIKGSPEWFWSPIDNLRTQCNVIIQYMKLLLFPWPGWLNIDHDFKISKAFFEYPTFFSMLAILFILFLGILLIRKRRLISFAIFWFFILLAPTSSLIPLWDMMVEYRLYLPILSYGILLWLLLDSSYRLLKNKLDLKNRDLIILIPMILILSLYGIFHHQRLKKFESGTALWEDAIQKSPQKARVYLNYGVMLYKEGRLEESLKTLQTALLKYPSHHPLVYYNLGVVYSDLGQYEKAIKSFMNFLEKNRSDSKVYYEIGNVYLRMGDLEKAESYFKKSLEFDPNWGPPYGGMGDILSRKGMIREAIDLYKKAIKYYPDSAPLYIRMGEAYIKIGQEKKALLEIEKAIKIDPEFSEAYTFLGGLYLRKGEGEKAFEYLKKAIELNPQNPESFNNLGLYFRGKGDIERAIEHYQKAIDLNPKFFEVYINLGEAYGAKRNYEEAIRSYQKAITLEPKRPEPYNNLGVIFLDKKDVDKAILHFKMAISIKEDYAEAYHNLAIAYYYKKDLPKVIQYGEKALSFGYSINPKLERLLKKKEKKAP